MTPLSSRSRALWNRSRLDLASEETLAQILEWGTLDEWREIYRLAAADPALRRRIRRIAEQVPLAYAGFWLAATSALGESGGVATAVARGTGRLSWIPWGGRSVADRRP
jgi:hypothetical protein